MNQEIDTIPEAMLNDDELIVRYLRGELSNDEEAAFMQKLNEDSDLKARAIAVARLIKGLENKGVSDNAKLIAAFKNISESEASKLSRQTGKSVSLKKILTIVISAAAVVVLVLGLRIMFVNSSYEKLAAEYENAFTVSQLARGGDEAMDAEINTLIDNVINGINLKPTIIRLTEIFEQSQSDTYNPCTNYYAVSGWYLWLAHLKNHDKENAKSILKTLAANAEEHPAVGKKAEEVLEIIDN